MRKTLKALLVFVLAFAHASTAIADAPFIWGPQSRSKALPPSGIGLSTGATIDYDGLKNYIVNPSGYGVAGANLIGYTRSGAMTATQVLTGLPSAKTGVAIQLAAGSAADYVRTCFTVDQGDATGVLGLTWNQIVSSFTTGDIAVEVHSFTAANCGGTDTKLALPSDVSGVTGLPNSSQSIKLNFSPTNGLTNYGVYFVRKAGTSTLTFSNLFVGPYPTVQGANVSTVFPTVNLNNFSSLSSNVSNLTFQRVGEYLVINGSATLSGTGTGSTPVTISFTGLTVATNQSGVINGGTTTLGKPLQVLCVSGGVLSIFNVSETNASNALTGSNFGTGSSSLIQTLYFNAVAVRINEWIGSGVVNLGSNDVQYACSTSGTWDAAASSANSQYGSNGCPISGSLTGNRAKVVLMQNPIQGIPVVQYHVPSTTIWVNQSDSQYPFVNLPTFSFGASPTVNSATQVTVNFSQFAQPGTTYNSSTGATNWSASTYDAWRLVAAVPGQTVPYGAYVPGKATGLVSSAGVAGRTDGGTPGYGTVGYVIMSAASVAVQGTNGNVASITLLPGRWRVRASVQLGSAPTGRTYIDASLTMTSGSASSPIGGPRAIAAASTIGSASYGVVNIPDQYYSVSTSTVLYLTANVSTTSSAANDYALIEAEEL